MRKVIMNLKRAWQGVYIVVFGMRKGKEEMI